MFTLGEKVVCVDDKFPDSILEIYQQLPVKDIVYVIRDVRAGVNADVLLMDMHRKHEPSLLVIGLYNQCNKKGIEMGFSTARFRSLEELKQSNTNTEKHSLTNKNTVSTTL